MMKRMLLILFVCFGATVCWAEIALPKVIASKMILQRGVATPVWGWADPGEDVTVEFAGQTKKTLPDATGKWMVKLDPMTASSESRVMKITGMNEIQLEDVLVGEVWLASGQSNMELTFAEIAQEEQNFAVAQKGNRLVRAFHVDQHLKVGIPMDDTMGSWKRCDEFLVAPYRSISAVGFFFALKLQQELGVPVAILDANWGGQRIECFIANEGYKALGLENRISKGEQNPKVAARRLRELANGMLKAAELADRGLKIAYHEEHVYGWSKNGIYNAMIAPLAPFAIKGVIWYQGESNRGANDYFEKLQVLSAGWSQVFNIKEIPFYQVQIAPFDYTGGQNLTTTTLCDTIWAAQYKGAAEIAGMGLVAIHDTNIDINNIHPVHKRPVAERLAAQALKKHYGKKVITTGPVFAGAKLNGSNVEVSFRDIDQGLSTTDGQAPSWFELSADGKTFLKADAKINGNTVEVSSAGVSAPKFVRMGWADIAIPNLQDKNGWPVFAFPSQDVK